LAAFSSEPGKEAAPLTDAIPGLNNER